VLKKVLSLVLTGLLVNAVAVSSSYARSQDEQARNVEKVKENVRKLGVGEEAHVEVKLQDGRKLKGYIREAGEDSFTVVDSKNGTATTVVYSQVKQIKGSNRSTAAKVGVNIAKGVGVVAVVAGIFLLLGVIIASGTR
jgi:hypothetical protein